MNIKSTIPLQLVENTEEYKQALEAAFRARMMIEIKLWSDHKTVQDAARFRFKMNNATNNK